jgi:hypothetical protein
MSNFYPVKYLVKLAAMKFLLLGVFVFFFVYIPLYLLNSLVMPDLNGLEQSYSHQGQTVQQLFPQR